MSAILPQPFFPSPGYIDTPVGAVIAYAGGTDVTVEALGWMLCDGRTLEPALYPELFAVLGYRYGGSAEHFQLPDYRSGSALAPGADAKPIGASYLIKYTYGLSPGRSV